MSEMMEYYITETSPGEFEVAKFSSMSGGEQPVAVYNVKYNPPRQLGRCNCPAGSYRGTANTDKHVLMVAQWITDGRPLQVMAESATKYQKKPKLKPPQG